MSSPRQLPLSVAIPCYRGDDRLAKTLERIAACDPGPSEILIHCDGGWKPNESSLPKLPVPIKFIHSTTQIGPGGGRNACLHAAAHELVASFDDDSWPLDSEYFAQAAELMEAMPNAAILSPAVYLKEKPILPQLNEVSTARYYEGSASIHRRSIYLTLPGFAPVPGAYGVEETDVSLQTHAAGYQILASPWLRAWHDRPLADNSHQILPWIKNEVLLAYLRYPWIAHPWAWWRSLRHAWRAAFNIGLSPTIAALCGAIPYSLSFRAYRRRYPLAQIIAHLKMPMERYAIETSSAKIQLFPLNASSQSEGTQSQRHGVNINE